MKMGIVFKKSRVTFGLVLIAGLLAAGLPAVVADNGETNRENGISMRSGAMSSAHGDSSQGDAGNTITMRELNVSTRGGGNNGNSGGDPTNGNEGQGTITDLACGDVTTIRMIKIEPGEFEMGISRNDPLKLAAAFDDEIADYIAQEEPRHRVKITKRFYMSETPITQKQYEEVIGTNPSSKKGDNLPVTNITYDEAKAFCAALQAKNPNLNITVRLATEAEWEYACRAGTDTVYFYGSNKSSLGDYAWYKDNSNMELQPVRQKRPNNWGLYDMLGNAATWCSDWGDKNYYSVSPTEDPQGPTSGVERVVRGCSFETAAELCRCSTRIPGDPAKSSSQVGLRIVLVQN